MMLAFLGLSVSRAVTREEVAEAVWPDSEPELARTSVRTALHALRSALGEDSFERFRLEALADAKQRKDQGQDA